MIFILKCQHRKNVYVQVLIQNIKMLKFQHKMMFVLKCQHKMMYVRVPKQNDINVEMST